VSSRKLNRTLEVSDDPLVRLIEVFGDITDFHGPGRLALAGGLGNRRKARFGDAVLGDNDFFALFGGVDKGREMRLGFVEIDRSSHASI
jgi:hypothetical protein